MRRLLEELLLFLEIHRLGAWRVQLLRILICVLHTLGEGRQNLGCLSVMVAAIAFPMILRTVSPIPMGRAPGHLSRAISLPATNAAPSILRAVLRMSWPSILSKMIGCGSVS